MAKIIRLRIKFNFFWMNVNFLIILSIIIPLFWLNIDYLIFLSRFN
jgi:hypothetical protein